MTILAKNILKKIVLIIVTISILLTFFITPSSYAKLDIEDGEFYYSGTTKGTYTVTEGVFSWLLNALGDIADWLVGIMTMGFRMVFVGYTALIERLLTWALETATGVNLNGDIVGTSTDLITLITSSNNVTVEAIVYNKVPALDINFFKLTQPETEEQRKERAATSGTGNKLVCEHCGRDVDVCCSSGTGCDGECDCENKDKCCNACASYLYALDPSNKAIIQELREQLAKWYYIIMVLAFAAMLVMLIVVGIKMAISSVASEKAVYKRMLVDWVVGFIIIVGIHLIMLFIITANEGLVKTVHDFSVKMNEKQMSRLKLMTLSEESGKSAYTNDEIEIKVYEEIRTRAYDPKLTVGLPGMVMYMTLVYFAVRYTIVYVKRLFTIMVLTLMGPGLGVAYAYQKVFSGRSPAYKTWLKEYIMNVIIQVVHAILYSVFVTQALILSLDSLAGMIIALVFLNYILKAEKLFRRIFKMGEKDSLLGKTADAGDPDNIKQPFNAVKSFIKADATRELGHALLHTPYANAIKGIGKAGVAGVAGAATGIAAAAGAVSKPVSDTVNNAVNRIKDKAEEVVDRAEDEGRDNQIPIRILRRFSRGVTKEDLDNKVEEAKEEIANAQTPDQKMEALRKYNSAVNKRNRMKKVISQPTAVQIVGARFKRAVDIRNTFDVSRKKTFNQNAAAVWNGIFGTRSINVETGRRESDKNGLIHQFSFTNLTGLDKKDKEALKDLRKTANAGLLGMFGVFAGMGLIVAHPKIGLGLLAAGHSKYKKAFGLRAASTKNYRRAASSKYAGKYTFSEFSEGAINNITETTRKLARDEFTELTEEGIEESRQRLRNADIQLSNQEDELARLSLIERFKSKFKVKDMARRAASVNGASVKNKGRKIRPPRTRSNINTLAGAIAAEERMRRRRQAKADVEDDGDDDVTFLPSRKPKSRNTMINLGVKYDKMMKKFEKKAAKDYEKAQKDYNARLEAFNTEAENVADLQTALHFERMRRKNEERARKEVTGDALVQEYRRMGYIYDPITKKVVLRPVEGEMPKIEVTGDDINKAGLTRTVRISNTVQTINTELDKVIKNVSKGRRIELTDEKAVKEVETKLEDRLRAAGILGEKQSVQAIFNGGRLTDKVKGKIADSNAKQAVLDMYLNSTLEKKDVKKVKDIVASSANLSKLTAEQIYEQMRKQAGITGTLTAEDKERIKIIDTYLKALKDENGEFDKLQAIVTASDEELKKKKKSVRKILDEMIEADMAEAGLLGLEGRIAEKADFDSRNLYKKLTSEDIKLINVEICAALNEFASLGKLDLGDEGIVKSLLEKITAKLRALGILSGTDTIDVIFKSGKLEEILVEQGKIALDRAKKNLNRVGPSVNSSKEIGIEILSEDINEEKAGRSYQEQDLVRMGVEIQAAIASIVAEGKIDITSSGNRKAILKIITTRLQKSGLLPNNVEIDEVFDMTKLDDIITTEAKKTTTKAVSLDKFIKTALTEEETAKVKAIVDSYSDGQVKYLNPEEVFARMVTDTGVQLSQEETREKRAVIEAYVEKVQELERASSASEEVTKKVSRKSKEQMLSDRKKKIDDILSVSLDQYASDPEKDRLLEAITSAEALSETGGEFTTPEGEVIYLSATEAKETANLLRSADKMIKVNRKNNKKNNRRMHMSIDTTEIDLKIKRAQSEYDSLVRSQGEDSPAAKRAKEKLDSLKKDLQRSIIIDSRHSDLYGTFDIESILKNEEIGKQNKKKAKS